MQEESFDARENAKKLANKFLEKGDSTGWFEALYREAEGDNEHIPWADLKPNKFLAEWAENADLQGRGRNALVVGCGLGDDAKFLTDLGFRVTGFDISPAAIEWAKKIHADTEIEFFVADLFDPPKDWQRKFDFVLEVYTIQALPPDLREKTIDAIADFVSENGELVVVDRGREENEELTEIPWPLSRKDLTRFSQNGLTQTKLTELFGDEEPPEVRFVVEYKRK